MLEHYVEDAKFISPKAASFVGNAVIAGKKALSEYWHLAAKKIEKIEFKLRHIVWDSDSNEQVIFYDANLNGVCSRACETMKFDSSGRDIGGSDVWGINLVASPEHPMSTLGHKQTCAAHKPMSALPPKADMCTATRYVRFVPIADIAVFIRSPRRRIQVAMVES